MTEKGTYIFNQKKECMDRKELEKLQLRRLKNVVNYVYDTVPYYQQQFDHYGVSPEDIKSLEDIKLLPFTTKDDLRKTYPWGMQAAHKDEIVEVHSTSGTTGIPTVVGYTQKDIAIWGEVVARGLAMAGVHKHDTVQNSYGYGLFTGGMGAHYGGQKIGAVVVPTSSGNTNRQLNFMKDFPADFLTCTPSYGLYLAESLEKEGIDASELPLRAGVFGAEMWTEEIRHKLENKLGISAHNIYGLTEAIGPGVATECMEQTGMHIQEDHFYPELINPDTLEPVGPGEKGELVITTLTKTGMPLIRFRTKDLTTLSYEKCACGRTTVRMGRIFGRSDDMLKVKGVIVFPSQVEEVLMKMDELAPAYMIEVSRPDILDIIEVQVEPDPSFLTGTVKDIEDLRTEIVKKLRDALGITVKVTIAEPFTIPRSEGKATRVIDHRDFS